MHLASQQQQQAFRSGQACVQCRTWHAELIRVLILIFAVAAVNKPCLGLRLIRQLDSNAARVTAALRDER